MKNPLHTPFVAIVQNEILLNSKRAAPYALIVLFSANAVLWSVSGAAVSQGWATNSDFYIVRNFLGFCFITGLPLFTAVIMSDPVIRDFQVGVHPLIFSKPVSRAAYLFGKFFGSFFVLVCCQAAFALTLVLLQVVHTSRMIVLPFRVFPYFKHFFFFVVISYTVFAALYFTIGTLTRNAKIVYAVALSFYPLYIGYQALLLKDLPLRWRVVLDPLLFNRGESVNPWGRSADYLDQMVISYGTDMIMNRALVMLIALVCLGILYSRFTIAEQSGFAEKFSLLDLSRASERVYYDSECLHDIRSDQRGARDELQLETTHSKEKTILRSITLPEVRKVNEGVRASLNKLIAAAGVEFLLLRAERSLVVIIPLAIFLSVLEVAFYKVTPAITYSAAYATNTANSLLLFLFGITVFYTGEAMHRDRELRVDTVLWSTPAPNNAFLLSKFLVTLLLALSIVGSVGLTAIVTQLLRGHIPVDVWAYFTVYSVILIPTIVFATALSVALNVLLHDKYLAYAMSVAICSGLFYLYSMGYKHWLYNPALYQLWNYQDLTGRGYQGFLNHRIYWLAVSGLCLSLAHLWFSRKLSKGLRIDRRPGNRGWSLLAAALSLALAIVTGMTVNLPTR